MPSLSYYLFFLSFYGIIRLLCLTHREPVMPALTRLLSDSVTFQAEVAKELADFQSLQGNGTGYALVNTLSSFTLSPVTRHGLNTAVGMLSLKLPSISLLPQGCWIEVYDVDYAAANNPATILAQGSDVISLYGSSAATQKISVSGMRALLVVNGSSWSMVV